MKFWTKYSMLTLTLIAEIVNEIEVDGMSKYFQAQRKEIRNELKAKLC